MSAVKYVPPTKDEIREAIRKMEEVIEDDLRRYRERTAPRACPTCGRPFP